MDTHPTVAAMMVTVGLMATAGACGTDPMVSQACVAVVQVGGLMYTADGEVLDPTAVDPEPFATVTRQIGCDDTIEHPGQGFDDVDEDGESNFLPPGATLHAIEGVGTSEALAVERNGEWQRVSVFDVVTPAPS